MHPEKATDWCGLWADGIIGPYFFKDAANRKVTMNGNRYREMIAYIFCPKCKSLTCMTCGFNGATCHTARLTMHLLSGEFGEHFSSLSGPVNWPPRLCDLTTWDYFCGTMLKLMSIQTIDTLEDNIEAFFHEIPAEMLKRWCQNWLKRMDHLKCSRDQHLHEIIFKH